MRLAEGELRGLAGELQRPVGDVLTDGETGDRVPRVADGDVAGTGADHDDQLGLVVGAVGRDRDVGGRAGEAPGELGEDHRDRRQLGAGLGGVRADS